MPIPCAVPSQFPAILWCENADGPTAFGTFPGYNGLRRVNPETSLLFSTPHKMGTFVVSQLIIPTVAYGFATNLLEGKYQM